MFQEKSATLGKANCVINSVLKSLKCSRSTQGFNDLWLIIQIFTEKQNTSISLNDCYQKQSKHSTLK